MATPLLHLGLLVRDQRRSLGFYATYFGFDTAGARRYPDGDGDRPQRPGL
jgi:catechol 2,3-dioxygenase-like lactoylglutathione lyase family enzyme